MAWANAWNELVLAPLQQTDNMPAVYLLIRMIDYSQTELSFVHNIEVLHYNRAYLFIRRNFSVKAST